MNMKTWRRSFNIFLLAAGVVLGGGCHSSGLNPNKQYATVSIFMEGRRGESLPVHIGQDPTPIYVAPEALLTEEDLQKATLLDNPDGTYGIQLTFNDHGKLVLDMQTTSNKGKHLVIFAKFPPKGWKEPKEDAAPAVEKPGAGKPRSSAWLAAPLIPGNGLSSGSLLFAPDVSHEEADQIVRGLNNMVAAMNKMDN
jgi:hypothetical protein